MSIINRPFDRKEAFMLYLQYLQWDEEDLDIAEMAIEKAQDFAEKVEKSAAQHPKDKSFLVHQSFGKFVPSGFSVYFVSVDGVTILIREFQTTEDAMAIAKLWNMANGNGRSPRDYSNLADIPTDRPNISGMEVGR